MKQAKKLSGVALATAAASLFLGGCASMHDGSGATAAKSSTVHCAGVNSCKGTSACKTADSACKGMNSCKGKGWIPLSKEECESKGGTVSG